MMYEALTSWENLLLAYQKAARGKRGRPNVAAFEHRLEDNLWQLQHELHTQTYEPSPYNSFYIHQPKKRLISAAPFRDRVVHHALHNLLEPLFEKSFIYDSYANRQGKGTHKGIDRCQQYARQYVYVLACDIRQFFPSIDHQILFAMIQKTVTDEKVLWLVQQILRSGVDVLSELYEMVYFAGDDLLASLRPRGLPIGNLTSQFWGNLYLNGFDHFVKRTLRCGGYVRYVDDFLLFADDKQTLWQWRAAIVARLAILRLVIHERAHPKPVREGIPFLGFVVYPQKRKLKRRCGLAYRRRLQQRVYAFRKGEAYVTDISRSVQGWVNHVHYANTVGLRKKVFGGILMSRR